MDAFEAAYQIVLTAEDDLNACGFVLPQPEGWGYFHGKASQGRGPTIRIPTDGHTAAESKELKSSKDQSFRYLLSCIRFPQATGWVTHYLAKAPIALEVEKALEFLELQSFGNCPFAGFGLCRYRFYPQEGGSHFDGHTHLANNAFDAYSRRFLSGIDHLLECDAKVRPFQMSIFPDPGGRRFF
jgi:hypothetical protein